MRAPLVRAFLPCRHLLLAAALSSRRHLGYTGGGNAGGRPLHTPLCICKAVLGWVCGASWQLPEGPGPGSCSSEFIDSSGCQCHGRRRLYHASSTGTQVLVAAVDDPACSPPVQGGERMCTAPAAWGTLPKSVMPGSRLTLFSTCDAAAGARCQMCPMGSSGECGGVMRHGSACWWAGGCRTFSLHVTAAQFCVLGPGRAAGQGRRAGREA